MARDFNGTDGYLDLGTKNFTGISAFSFAVIMTVDSFQAAFPRIRQIFGIEDGSGTSQIFFWRFGNNGAIADGQLQFAANGLSSGLVSTTTFSTATEYCFVLTYDGSNLRLWVNGTLDKTQACTGNVGNANNGFQIGRMTEGIHGGRLFDGMMSEVAVWTRALNTAEAEAISGKRFSPSFFPQNLSIYVPIIGRASPEPDLKGGSATVNGTMANLSHPRVIYPSNYQIAPFSAGGAPATSIKDLIGIGMIPFAR